MTRATVSRAMRAALACLVLAWGLIPAIATATADPTVWDKFKTVAYNGNDGTTDWLASWMELPWTDGPSSGAIRVVSDTRCADETCLRIGGDERDLTGLSILRAADLSGADEATLTFDYRRQVLDDDSEASVRVRVSTNLITWTTLATYQINSSDDAPSKATFDISEHAAMPTYVGFFGSGEAEGYLYIDNVKLTYSTSSAPPRFDPAPADRTDPENVPVTVTATATDPDGDDAKITYSASGLPPGLAIDKKTGVISGTPNHGARLASPYDVSITATDATGSTATVSFTWRITGTNSAPALDPIVDQSVAEGTTFTLTASAQDPDLPYDTLTFSLLDAPSGAEINHTTGAITWSTAEEDGPGTYSFTVKVADDGSPSKTDTHPFTVTVTEKNAAPIMNDVPAQTNGVDDVVSLATEATDPDLPANTLTFTATGLPPGLSIAPATGRIAGTATTPGIFIVRVTATDNGSPARADSAEFTWRVTYGNHSPTLASISAQTPDPDGVVRFTASATDPDGDDVTFWLDDASELSGATLNPATGAFTWTPSTTNVGRSYSIVVGVIDDGFPQLADSQTVVITVPRPNRAPVLTAVPGQRSAEGSVVNLAMIATDADDDVLMWTAGGLPPGLNMTSAGRISGVVGFDAARGSPHTVTVTVTDDGDPKLHDTIMFTWIVDNTNRPPQIDDLTLGAKAGTPRTIQIEVSDADGDPITLTASTPQVGKVTSRDTTFTYLAPAGFTGVDSFEVTAGDGTDETMATITINVRTTNAAPVANDDSYTVTSGERFAVRAPGVVGNDNDDDGDPVEASLASGPAHGTVTLDASGAFVYQPDDGFAGTDQFTYTVSDGTGGSDQAVVSLEVTPAVPVTGAEERVAIEQMRSSVMSETALGIPPPTATPVDRAAAQEAVSRVVLPVARGGFASVPAMQFPLLLLFVALLLGATIGRIGLHPVLAIRRSACGLVRVYDDSRGFGLIIPDDGGTEIFVPSRALRGADALSTGDTVRYVAVSGSRRPTATRVWRTASA